MLKKTLCLTAAIFGLTVMPVAPSYAQRLSQLPSTGMMGLLGQSPATPQAEPDTLKENIVAVVNESIITSSDLKARLSLAALSAGMPNTPEVQAKLRPQVLRALIDEQLELQEGKKENVSVTAQEMEEALRRLANDNKIPGGDMLAFLKANNVPPDTLRDQIKAALTWNKVVMRVIRPHIDIGDDEVDAVIQRMRANAGKQEFLISEIFLAVDKPEDEAQVQALADKLVEQVKGGTPFGAAARQFSQGLGAGNGGDLGWLQIGQLAPEIDKVLPSLKNGDIAGPIRTGSGYHIIGLRDKRTLTIGNVKDMSVKLQQLFRPFSPEAGKEKLLREAASIRQSIQDCTTLRETVEQSYPAWSWQDLGEVKLDKAPTWLAEKVAPLDEGRATDPMATDKGALILYVCGRNVSESADKDSIRRSIGSEKMELMARRLQRDLRKNAYIDVRIKK